MLTVHPQYIKDTKGNKSLVILHAKEFDTLMEELQENDCWQYRSIIRMNPIDWFKAKNLISVNFFAIKYKKNRIKYKKNYIKYKIYRIKYKKNRIKYNKNYIKYKIYRIKYKKNWT